MDTIHQRFPQYDEGGQALIDKAYAIASAALADETRGNGHPFIEHPVNVALIAADEIGLPADCVAAVFLHEATRKHPEIDLRAERPLMVRPFGRLRGRNLKTRDRNRKADSRRTSIRWLMD